MNIKQGMIAPVTSIVVPAYNSPFEAQKLLSALSEQDIPSPIELILVDDGSQPPLTIKNPNLHNLNFLVIRLNTNSGRACARNAGIHRSSGTYVTFLDVDCIPTNNFIRNLIKALSKSPDILFGHIKFYSGDRFFDSYENNVQEKRRSSIGNWASTLTSANVTIKKDILDAVNGFDQTFKQYGFEDRDLFLRIKKTFPSIFPYYCDRCTVVHVDKPYLHEVLRKFTQSGQYTAPIFRTKHPDIYGSMLTHYFDAQFNRILKPIPNVVLFSLERMMTLLSRATFWIGYSLSWDWLAEKSLKLLKGLAYLHGTLLETRENG